MNSTTAILMNTNNISNFSISFVSRPKLNYGVVSIVHPGISIQSRQIHTGGRDVKLTPTPNRNMDPVRESTIITFNASEHLENYYEIFSWIKSYTNREYSEYDIISDIIITYYDLNKKAIRNVILKNAFPVSLSSVELSTMETEARPIKFNATFEMTEIIMENI